MNERYRVLAELLFFASAAQLALCLFRVFCRSKRAWRLTDGAGFLALLLLTSLVSAASVGERCGALPSPPFLLPLAVLVTARAFAEMRRAYRASRETLSPSSVKQALDNLNSGVLFADGMGRAILVNHTMGRLAEALTGSYPQTLDELENALASPRGGSGVERLSGSPALYRFPDGRVWRFRTVPLTDAAMAGYTQTTAQDMTELYEANARLERENEALREAIGKTRRMMDRIADRIREQETLNLKMRIHNDIGASLIALTEMARGGARDDFDRQLETLRFAVGCFSRRGETVPDAFADVSRQAAEMGVALKLEGYIPQNQTVERLIAAAARECATNCVRHAKGGTVAVRVSERGGVCTAEFTNDGRPPEGPIAEGDGLSALRRSVERAGGEMRVSHAPRFLLILNMPEKEPEP